MNIDSSNILTLLSGESLEKLQQTMQLDEGLSKDFAETLLDKIRQLTGLDTADDIPGNLTKEISGDGNKQHEIAGLLNERGIADGFASLFGKDLPIGNKLEKDIDLENTLEALANVMNTLEDVGLEQENLETKLELLLEKAERIREAIPEQIALDEQAGIIGEEGLSLTGLTEGLDKVVDSIKQIKDKLQEESTLLKKAGLESEIERLAAKFEHIKDVFLEKSAAKLAEKKDDATNNQLQIEGAGEVDENLQLTNQLAGIVAALNEPQDKEKMTVVPVIQEPKPEQKKEALSLKQMAEERALGLSPKTESETLLQQENGSRKSGPDNPVITAKQYEKTDFLDIDAKKIESGNEKTLPRFATDIANLNRAVMHENKLDLAPMTRHFAHPEWNKEVAERVIWMHKQEIPSAELRLNPRHLGPITIKIDVTQDQATVAFTAQHAAVKDAIEAALPKLREMFSAQQLNLTDVNVSQDDAGQRQARSHAQTGDTPGKNEQQERDEMANNEQAEKAKEMTDEIEAGRAIASNGILSIFA